MIAPLRLDIGCGKNKKAGFTGVDAIGFDGVDIVADVVKLKKGVQPWRTLLRPTSEEIFEPWMWETDSVEEIHSSHFVEHLTRAERVHFFNEAWRVLKPEGKLTVVVPHWASNRAYGDPTHDPMPVAEFAFYYLSPEWRAVNAPHDSFLKCNFVATWGYSMHGDLLVRAQDYQQFALQWLKEAAQDMHATLVAKK